MAGPSRIVHDAPEGAYAARAVIDASGLSSIQEANHAFLGLLAEGGSSRHVGAGLGLGAAHLERIRRLDAAARMSVAECPYTLFDLRFGDLVFWRSLASGGECCARAECPRIAAFSRTAVFLAWHFARSDELAASLVLGMSAEAQRLWRGMPVCALETAARCAAPELEARWGQHPTFWTRLLDTDGPGGRDRGEAVRLLGLQLIAADGVWPAAFPAAPPSRPG